ncbi:MAG: hypothetical protein V7637_2326 [Mycobacteriales bacterium]|jgi:hypothetical protein
MRTTTRTRRPAAALGVLLIGAAGGVLAAWYGRAGNDRDAWPVPLLALVAVLSGVQGLRTD